jgi:hypothetical protein
MDSSNDTSEGSEGSWMPTLVVVLLCVLKWLISSHSNTAIGLRRFLQMKVQCFNVK